MLIFPGLPQTDVTDRVCGLISDAHEGLVGPMGGGGPTPPSAARAGTVIPNILSLLCKVVRYHATTCKHTIIAIITTLLVVGR